MKKEELKTLFKKYADGTCTEEEKSLLENWYLQYNEPGPTVSEGKIQAAKNLVFLQLPGNESGFPKIGLRLMAAAILIGVLITVTLSLLNLNQSKPKNNPVADLPPGTNKATLTIGKGQDINLTDALNGTITRKGGVTITKNKTGEVTFTFSPSESIDHTPNTISTPAGGQWQVRLSDGTEVWLNAASRLTFPASFAKLENRIVTLEGEGYFEVAKDAAHPFVVISGTQRVEVLGTHFNINCYTEESSIKTTLLEGKVKVSVLGVSHPAILKPGEQATVSAAAINVKAVDTDESIAWKEGYFQFDDEPIQSVMRKLARWYDVEVKVSQDILGETLTGKVSRNTNISQVIKALEATRSVHFTLEGRRITVMK